MNKDAMIEAQQKWLRSEWQEALSRTLKSPTFEEWLKARQDGSKA